MSAEHVTEKTSSRDVRTATRWFLGTMVVLPVVAYVFSGEGLFLLKAAGPPAFDGAGLAQRWLWLAVGLVIAFTLSALAVGRWHAPSQLWFVALAGVILQTLRLAQAIPVLYFYSSAGAAPMVEPREIMLNVFARTPFEAPQYYFAATIGYLCVVGLGCWIGMRTRTSATEAA